MGPIGPVHIHAINIIRFWLLSKGTCKGEIMDLSFPAGSSVNDGINLGFAVYSALLWIQLARRWWG